MKELFENLSDASQSSGPFECLGIEFESDEQRREYFLQKLKEKLQDPEFKSLDGFPKGNDEDILALSDPPYFTACPNPFIEEYVKINETDLGNSDSFVREPFAADISEGKSDPIYRIHQYHTKVPHKAIMRYILHFTQPGDIIFDGFCGSGMTGIAAQLCSDSESLKSLGFIEKQKGELFDQNGNFVGKKGYRKAILNDLSPAATLISAGYNLTKNPRAFSKKAIGILDEFNKEYGWMYMTKDPDSGDDCEIDVVIWSDIFNCPYCAIELEFWSLAYDSNTGKIREKPLCTNCSAEVSKRDLINLETKYFDNVVDEIRTKFVQKPVEIRYQHHGTKKKKYPDENDIKLIQDVEKLLNGLEYPTDLMMFVPEGERWGDDYRKGIGRVHDFYLTRQLVTYSILWQKLKNFSTEEERRLWRFSLQSVLSSFTRRNRFLKGSYAQTNRNLSGTLYMGSTVSEPSPNFAISGKLKRIKEVLPVSLQKNFITTQSLSSVCIPENSIDYVFIDPPFGNNLSYSELNFTWESWLRVFTNMDFDAVVNRTHGKQLSYYTNMMTLCLKKIYKILKPGRWLTVEFHNSQNAVWTAIQEAIGQAGFIVADVRILDKGELTKKQQYANAVKKDLVISAYKPNSEFETNFSLNAGTEEGVWDFIRSHLENLPKFVANKGVAEIIPERQGQLLFDRMVAFHVQRDLTLPISATEFYSGLEKRFSKRDDMYFLPVQVAEYDKNRMSVQEILQLELAIADEESAIQWIRQKLTARPQTAGELKPQFMQESTGWQKNEKMLELDEILEQNFLCYDGTGDVPSQIHSYLSSNYKELRKKQNNDNALKNKGKERWYVPDPQRAGDLEKLRERALLREFNEYRTANVQQLKVFRLEAVRAGFKVAWQERNYSTIISVANKIPDNILQEDQKLLMWYDQAITRLGDSK